MKRILTLFIAFSLFTSFHLMSQVSLSDSSIGMHIAGVGYGFVIPGNDFSERFGNGNILYISYSYKLRSQFIFEINTGYLYSSNVKENKILSNIATSDGYLISSQGMLNPIEFTLKGFLIDANIKYLIPLWPNPNSGLYFGAGGGFLQHKIGFDYDYGPLTQIEGDYLKGYDRLSNGTSISQHIGYYFFSDRNLGNFNLGFSVFEAFTKNRRDFNFDEHQRDDKKRIDILYLIRFGMNIPLYKKAPPKYY